MKHINSAMVDKGMAEMDAALAVIPLERAGVCVNCDRIFTIFTGQTVCPKCMSTAWRPVKAWLDVHPLVHNGGRQ